MESLGICLGASTIGLVRIKKTEDEQKVLWAKAVNHEGNPRKALVQAISELNDISYLKVAATGRKFREFVAFSSISEPEAVELAVNHLLPQGHPYRVVVSAGGETFMVYHLDDDGRIQDIHTGNKCASGTGEFFLQQLGRMKLSLEEVAEMGVPDGIHKVSGRCSVFCKSDCTHALNKGVPKPHVVAGLTKMMAGKIFDLLKKLPKEHVILTGGCAFNKSMVHYLKEEIPDLFIPKEAGYFEALGAGIWAMENETLPFPGINKMFKDHGSRFATLNPLKDYKDKVSFKHHPWSEARPGDETILGLDVGSTTTKGVIMRRSDKAILAADYLRTDGDPVGASRRVYESLNNQIKLPISIVGLGVTGSGRQIAGLHAMTDGVINEIIAHATAAVHFDPDVDTIFEIGGQDAKYTYITNSVPSDYAMNEACSAGTGSFLEESAKESLGVPVTEIGKIAYQGKHPPNFNDQCAAFIGSDIKGAVQEGIPLEDILAGLVYSICMNYTNRVKGNRPVGEKVFMQGGVCYNEAIPAAMAALTGKEIVVPPDPGLMGAFGVALEVDRRMEKGLLEPRSFDLDELSKREVEYLKPFKCRGGKEKCDRGCEIARIRIGKKIFPFGGICNRYDNIIHKRKVDTAELNLVIKRERRVFRDLSPEDPDDRRPTVGMNRSFLVNTFFPFYNRFFSELGLRLVLPDEIDPEGVTQKGAAFCYPVEIAHGYFSNLLSKKPDFVFLPHLRGIDTGITDTSCACVFVQSEPFYLRSAFSTLSKERVISPYLDFSKGFEANKEAFIDVARKLGYDKNRAQKALSLAISEMEEFYKDMKAMGQKLMKELDEDPEQITVVLFGRPYNSFVMAANKGIPAKFASRGFKIVPFDMLPFEREELPDEMNMYWAMGRMILKAANFVNKNPQLFGTYITNFSCGPDSFIITYFRDAMGKKPSLTLELDSHTADAGIETRIEAFLDIVNYYRQLEKRHGIKSFKSSFRPARIEFRNGKAGVLTSNKRWLPLTNEKVKMVLPSMGRLGTPLLAKAFSSVGVRCEALPPANEEILKLGRGNASCKECLPLQITVGSILNYLMNKRPTDEITAYFMPTAPGPCRFGQYNVFSKRVIAKYEIPDCAIFSPTSLNGYGGLGHKFTRSAWRTVIIGDLLDEIWSTILAGAKDREKGLAIFDGEYQNLMHVIDKDWKTIAEQLKKTAKSLSQIELKAPYHEIPKVSLIGEIYVRHDPVSLQNIIEKMADRGFIVRTAQTSEWINYTDWLIKTGIEGERSLGYWIKHFVMRYFDRKIRKLLSPSGLFFFEYPEIDHLVDLGKKFISPRLTGEAILTVGAAFYEILHPSCGIISIGPFGCMPTRVAESILTENFNTAEKRLQISNNNFTSNTSLKKLLKKDRKLPFLAIETDGNPFPQVIEARLEAFCLQAKRLNDSLIQSH